MEPEPLTSTSKEEKETLRVKLSLQHPNCWSEKATSIYDAGLLGHGVFTGQAEVAKGRFTAYADTKSTLDALVVGVKEMDLTGPVMEIQDGWKYNKTDISAPGNAITEIFVTFRPENALDDYFLERGFVYDGPVHIKNGVEYWHLMGNMSRSELKKRIREVEVKGDAEITIERISNKLNNSTKEENNLPQLTVRQKEIFTLAKEHGYYNWPRDVSAKDLAKKTNISKATFLEHLRKAEAKLLQDYEM